MAVLVEAISVIVRSGALEHFSGGWTAFRAGIPNRTFCSDRELLRIGFMHPADVEAYVKELEGGGITYLANGAAQDLVVVDQMGGFAAPCSWAEFGLIEIAPHETVAACRLKDSASIEVAVPQDWRWEDSMSATFGFVPTGSEASLTKIDQIGGVEEYSSPLSDRPVYVGRTRRLEDPDQG
jgi:hypothetical protein